MEFYARMVDLTRFSIVNDNIKDNINIKKSHNSYYVRCSYRQSDYVVGIVHSAIFHPI